MKRPRFGSLHRLVCLSTAESHRRVREREPSKAMGKRQIPLAIVGILSLWLAPAARGQNTVRTVAGGGPNNLPALKSGMGFPRSAALDHAGNLYVGDLYANLVLRISTTGNVTVVAGNGQPGAISGGDGGLAVDATITAPNGVALDSSGDIFITDGYYCRIRKISAPTGIISTVAGTGSCGYSGDGGPATSAQLNGPSGVALDASGDIFIDDTQNCLLRKVAASTGIISTLAGTPPDAAGSHCAYSGAGGLAISAELFYPEAVVVDGPGNLFIADTSSCAIREISASTGIISTVAGTGSCGYNGTTGPATSIQLSDPWGVAVDGSGNIFIADTENCLVREVAASTGVLSTLAGTPPIAIGSPSQCGYSGDGGAATNAQIDQPFGVAVDSSDDIFITDTSNALIREVFAATGDISTFAGVTAPNPTYANQLFGLPGYSGDGYPATDAELGVWIAGPYDVGFTTDHLGNVFIADVANNAIREVSAATGIITTVAGNGFAGYSGDGGPATSAELYWPRDVAVDGSGNIFIADSFNCVIRKVTAATGIISTVAGTPPDSSGNYFCKFSGDGGPATSAELNLMASVTPAGGVAVDGSGDIFIADSGNDAIREVAAATGTITTVAGGPDMRFTGGGDGGPATSATLSTPYGVAVDAAGNIFISDTDDAAIRVVTAINGDIYTLTGSIRLGGGFYGDGGPPGSAQIGHDSGLFLDPAGNLFIPDDENCVIREISGSTDIISTVAGTPNRGPVHDCGYGGDGGPALSAVFNFPSSAAADTTSDLLVLDSTRVRSVAGLLGAPAAAALPFPNPLVFPTVADGTAGTLTEMLVNTGSLATSVSTLAISGTNAADFSETDNCAGQSLTAGGGTCAIKVKFIPSILGAESAVLTISDSAGTQTVSLTGTGTSDAGFSASTTTVAFGNQQETVKSSPMSVTVMNNGTAGLITSAVGVDGPNAGDFAISANSCSGATVAANATCAVSVTFTPSTTGAENASLNFADNTASSPQSVALTGTGTDFSIAIAPGGSTTATVAPGSTATDNLQVTPISGFNGTVTLSCTGAPSQSTCTPLPASATLNGNGAALFSVQITTTAPSVASLRVGRQWRSIDGLRILQVVLVAGLASTLLVFALRFRESAARRRRAYVFAISFGFLLLASVVSGCGGGSASSSSPPPSSGTPAGNYTLTITGTSNGVSRSQTLTLIVN
jgi:hypothetical protein